MTEHLKAKIGQYVLIRNDEGKILMFERPKSKSWCLPGGRLEEHERDWKVGLLREIEEETSLKCSNPKPIGVEIEEDPYQIKYCTYFMVDCPDLSTFKLDEEEHSDYKWIDKEEAEKLNIESGKLKRIILDNFR